MHTKQKGQVVIIAALLMSIFAVIGASVATQMVYEQRRAKTEEKSQKAYYAAESAMEDALRLLKHGSYTNKSYLFDDVGVNTSSTTIGNSTIIDFSSQNISVNSGENIPVDLTAYTGSSLIICWNEAQTSILAQLYYTTASGEYRMYPFVYNSTAFQNPKIQNANTAFVSLGCGKSGWYNATLSLTSISDYAQPDFIAVWILYTDGVSIALEGDQNIPEQGKIINSTATIPELSNTVTRRLKYYITNRTFPPMAMMFGVFNGGGVSFGPGKNW